MQHVGAVGEVRSREAAYVDYGILAVMRIDDPFIGVGLGVGSGEQGLCVLPIAAGVTDLAAAIHITHGLYVLQVEHIFALAFLAGLDDVPLVITVVMLYIGFEHAVVVAQIDRRAVMDPVLRESSRAVIVIPLYLPTLGSGLGTLACVDTLVILTIHAADLERSLEGDGSGSVAA